MKAKEIQCKIGSFGAWGSYFENWQALQGLLQGHTIPEKKLKGPKPAIIPANERRRAPLPVRLAVESSWQATSHVGIEPDLLNCVFVSGLGDTDLTDYMCKVLASDHKELSPTKFHNSVHNAAAGYWTISTKTMRSANSVAGYKQSVSLALFEAMVQCQSEKVPVLVTFYDAPVSKILEPLLLNPEAFAFSLVLFPPSHQAHGPLISAKVEQQELVNWPPLTCSNSYIQSLYKANPSAKIMCLAELFEQKDKNETANLINMPLSEGTSLSIHLL